jgi:hypothetical protein
MIILCSVFLPIFYRVDVTTTFKAGIEENNKYDVNNRIEVYTWEVLENAPNNDKDHLFPVKEFGNKRDINSVLNITWMSDETNRNIKRYEKPSVYIPNEGSSKLFERLNTLL